MDRERERKIVEQGRAQGKSDEFIKQAVLRDRQTRQQVAPTIPQPVQKTWENRAIGVAQSLLGTAIGTARGLQNVGLGVMGALGADTSKYGFKSLKADTQEGRAVTAAITPQNKYQQQGKLVGDVAQYIAPASKINKATSALPFLQRVAARTAPDIATSVAQNLGADTKQTGVNAGITGLTSGVANALIPGPNVGAVRTFAQTAAPGYVADVATGLAGQRGEDRTGGKAFIPGVGTALSGTIGAIQAVPAARQALKERGVTKTIEKRTNTLTTMQRSNKPLDRKIVAADRSGIDTKKFIAESDLLVGAVDNNGTVNSKVAVSNLEDVLKPWEARVGESLATENKRVPINAIKDKVLASVDNSGLIGSMKQQARARAIAELEALALEADDAGTVPLKLVHDLKVQVNKNNAKSFIDPEKNAIGKTFGRGLKEFVEESTDAMDVKTYNQELRKLYSVRDVLEAMDGKKVEGGRLGKYFAQVIGGVAGNAIGGPVGAIAGAEVGSQIKGAQMSRAFGGNAGTPVKPTQTMMDALNPQARSMSQTAPAITNSPPKTVIPRTIPQPQKQATPLSTAERQGVQKSSSLPKSSTRPVSVAKEEINKIKESVAFREAMLDEFPHSSAKNLMRYYKNGDYSLSEVNYRNLGAGRKSSQLDSHVTELGFKDMDEAQDAIDKYIAERDSVAQSKRYLRQLQKEVRKGEDMVTYDTGEYLGETLDDAERLKIVRNLTKERGAAGPPSDEWLLTQARRELAKTPNDAKLKSFASRLSKKINEDVDIDALNAKYMGKRLLPNRRQSAMQQNIRNEVKDIVAKGDENDLLVEARKYKTAEEFLDNLEWKPLGRGIDRKNLDSSYKIGGTNIYVVGKKTGNMVDEPYTVISADGKKETSMTRKVPEVEYKIVDFDDNVDDNLYNAFLHKRFEKGVTNIEDLRSQLTDIYNRAHATAPKPTVIPKPSERPELMAQLRA